MNWFTLSLLAGFTFDAARVAARVSLKGKGDPMAYTAIHDFIAGIALLPFIFTELHFPTLSSTWLYFLAYVFFAFLTDWLAFLALKNINVSEYQILNQTRHIFVLIGGFLLFSEAITGSKIALITLIIFGVVIATYEKSKLKLNRGILYALLSTFFAVITFHFVKLTVIDFSETAAASLGLIGIALLSFICLKFRTSKIRKELNLNAKGLILAGVLFAGFELAIFFALKVGEISKVIPVTQSSLIFAVLGGILFLGERSRLWQKIIGTSLICLGIVLMYFI